MPATPHRFESPPGGVMTAGADGAISGDLQVRVLSGSTQVHVEVAYAETDDWYPVAGGVLPQPDQLRADVAALVAGVLSEDPGIDGDGNPRCADLTAFDAGRLHPD